MDNDKIHENKEKERNEKKNKKDIGDATRGKQCDYYKLLLSFFLKWKAVRGDQFVACISISQGSCFSQPTLNVLEQSDARCLLWSVSRFPHSFAVYPVISLRKYPATSLVVIRCSVKNFFANKIIQIWTYRRAFPFHRFYWNAPSVSATVLFASFQPWRKFKRWNSGRINRNVSLDRIHISRNKYTLEIKEISWSD